MKFPKSVHAEGWADHIDTTKPEHLPDALKDGGHAPLHAARATGGAAVKAPGVTPTMATAVPVSPVVPPVVPPAVFPTIAPAVPLSVRGAAPRAEARSTAAHKQAAAVPPQRDQQRTWMIAAGAGVAIVAALAVWAVNRPSEGPITAPAAVTGSVEPQTEVAAATPAPGSATTAQADSSQPNAPTASAEPTPAEPAPARLGPPVTTVRPAPESKTVAQAPVPAPRPDLVVRANPRNPAPQPEPRSGALQPLTVATAPGSQPQALPPGSEPVTMPPTAAGPATATTPQPAAVTPLASTTPDTAAPGSASPGTAPLAQAAPTPEDTGITVKVRSALAADVTLAAVPIAVSTDHGVVKLEGQAPDAQARERATVVAAGTMGVKAVDNRLTLRPPAVLSQAPSGL